LTSGKDNQMVIRSQKRPESPYCRLYTSTKKYSLII
jgi:hypothetical protein